MDQVVQTNAAQTEELSATAEQLSDKAIQLQAVVSQFNLTRFAPSALTQSSRKPRARTQPIFASKPRTQTAPAKAYTSAHRSDIDSVEKEVEKELEMLTAASSSDAFQSF